MSSADGECSEPNSFRSNSQVQRREREAEEMYGICNIMWNKKLAKMERRNAIN